MLPLAVGDVADLAGLGVLLELHARRAVVGVVAQRRPARKAEPVVAGALPLAGQILEGVGVE